MNPALLGGRSDFEDRYAKPIAEGAPGAAAKLRERLRPFLLRRLKRDVTPELPPRTEMVEHCELAQEERAVYEAIRAATREEIVSRLRAGGSVLAALEALLRPRQACCHVGLMPGQSAETSSKVELLLENIEETGCRSGQTGRLPPSCRRPKSSFAGARGEHGVPCPSRAGSNRTLIRGSLTSTFASSAS